MNFYNKEVDSFGGDRVRIFRTSKSGSTSLKTLLKEDNKIDYNSEVFSTNIIYVLLLRNPIEKWQSGVMEDITWFRPHNKWTKVNNFLLNHFEKDGDNESIFRGGHSAISRWIEPGYDTPTLIDLLSYDNIYFTNLKNLSNPKFLGWLQKKDDSWKSIKSIPFADGSTKERKGIWKMWKRFWDGNNKNILNPYDKNTWNYTTKRLFEYEIKTIDFIKKTSKYLEFK